MGIQVPRRKKRVLALSLLYRLNKILPFSNRRKLKWYLDLEWIFDRLALEGSFHHYPPDQHPHRLSAERFFSRHLRPEMRVLDLGCASGDLSAMISKYVAESVGVDHDPAAVARAQKSHQRPGLSFVHRDALQFLKEEQKEYDVLVLSHILEHLDGPEEFLRGFKDHFRWMYIEVPDFDKTYLNLYRKDLGNALVYTDDDHVTEFDREDLAAILHRVGIEIVEAEYRFGIQRLWCRVPK